MKSLKKYLFGKKLRLNVIAIILVIMVLAPMVAAAEKPNPGVVPVNSNFHGKTYGDWSAEWWKWVLSIPADRNPLNDTTGKFTTEAQSGDVWFLTGSWIGTKELKINVPAGKAIFFPIINAECSKIEGNGNTQKELRAAAKALIDNVTVKEAIIDGRRLNLDNYRVASKLFYFRLPAENNILNVTVPPYSSPAVSDGYWIMLKPLSEGKHKIYIYGKAEHVPPDNSEFVTEMNYTLNVMPKRC